MSTRTIVTSQPDVACDVCERRLLRGEQPETFIAAGRRLTVCELCAPRAANEGWMRERDAVGISLPPARGRRRGLLDRLRQVGRTTEADEQEPATPQRRRPAEEAPLDWAAEDDASQPLYAPVEAPAPGYLEQALDSFNASEFPRRIAGVSRSLGAPEVSVASAEHLDSVVRVIVAWELSWYRYEVDLSDGPAAARLLDQGTELDELAPRDRLANASADASGTLTLAP